MAVAGEATKRAAQRTKLKGDVELLKRKIKSLKQDFGVKVYCSLRDVNNITLRRGAVIIGVYN
jgi:hypothetical protein